jgi:Etoposide-induced protein 2.4 (EI24)
MSTPVRLLVSSFMRASASVLHPRMLWLTVLPFLVSALLWGTLLWFMWSGLVALVQAALAQFELSAPAFKVLTVLGWYGLHMVVAPFLTITLLVPVIVVTVLLLIAGWTMPAVVRHLARRRYVHLEPLHGGSWYGGVAQALLATAVFLLLVLLSLPLWLVPPLFAVIPPLLWGWLTYRVMSYDALALHASPAERRTLLRRHRWPLLGIGVATGLLGSLPALIWVSSVAMIVLFPLVALAAIWLYVVIFIFSALWFGHFCLHALDQLRRESGAQTAPLDRIA